MKKADIDTTMVTMEGEQQTAGGLYMPGKDRVVFKRPENKSLLGLDALALAKRGGSMVSGGFKVPGAGVTSLASSLDDEEKSLQGMDSKRAKQDYPQVLQRMPSSRYPRNASPVP